VGLSPSALAQDEAIVNQLAGVLALEDARRFDPARFAEAARFPEPLVRGHAALAMGRIGDTTALPILVELLADEDSVVQEDAAFAMGLLGSTSALAPLRDRALLALRTGGRSSAVEGVTAIAMIGGANAASIIEEILRQASAAIQAGEESPVALRAVGETWRLGPDAPVAALVQIAQSGNAPFRRQAVYALTRLRAREGGTVIFNAARDSVAQIRAWAARTLTARYADSSGLGRDAVTSIVTQLVNDDDAGVRVNALRALATFEDSRLARVALDLTADPDFNVRFEVLMAVGRLAASESLAALTEALSGSLPALQAAALTSLARLDHNAALREAASWIIASDPRKRMVGADALGVIGAPLPAYLDALITSYDLAQGDLIPDARMAVVRALGRIAELGSLQEFAVGDQFLRRFPTCEDYLVRQVADEHLPAAARQWGPAFPVETGREIGDYRDIVRRLLLPAARGEEVPQLVIETDRGEIIVSLFAADAPLTVNAMLELADRRYFDAGRWHRVVPNFVIQDGDPRGDGWGGPGYVLRDEINRRRYGAGTVGMALSGPDTGGSQFFITHAPQPHLDGTYTVIGQVEQGNDIVGRIMQSDRIRTMRRR
jgi:cyclophilin family peptidyl-prolyl cis-trans isomerase/HEAT repeat protein